VRRKSREEKAHRALMGVVNARLEMMRLQITTKQSMQPQVMKHVFLFQSQASSAMLEWGLVSE
jgi:hypothetical protein